jgi:hypothetical protein
VTPHDEAAYHANCNERSHGEDPDGPTWCPKCGARTEYTQTPESPFQFHTCLNPTCRYPFRVEWLTGSEVVDESMECCPNCKVWSDDVLPFGKCGLCYRD